MGKKGHRKATRKEVAREVAAATADTADDAASSAAPAKRGRYSKKGTDRSYEYARSAVLARLRTRPESKLAALWHELSEEGQTALQRQFVSDFREKGFSMATASKWKDQIAKIKYTRKLDYCTEAVMMDREKGNEEAVKHRIANAKGKGEGKGKGYYKSEDNGQYMYRFVGNWELVESNQTIKGYGTSQKTEPIPLAPSVTGTPKTAAPQALMDHAPEDEEDDAGDSGDEAGEEPAGQSLRQIDWNGPNVLDARDLGDGTWSVDLDDGRTVIADEDGMIINEQAPAVVRKPAACEEASQAKPQEEMQGDTLQSALEEAMAAIAGNCLMVGFYNQLKADMDQVLIGKLDANQVKLHIAMTQSVLSVISAPPEAALAE